MAMAALLAAGQRDVGLVGWVSFELMCPRGVRQALAFDERVVEQRFTVFPAR